MNGRVLPETYCPAAPTLWIRPGRATYIGPSFRLDPHSAAVHCVALGIDAPFELRAADIDPQYTRSAFIPARTRHHIIATTGRMLFDYSHSREPRDQMTVHTKSISWHHRDEAALIQSLTTAPHALWQKGDGRLDSRVHAAMRTLNSTPDLSVTEVAATVHLSASRFQHLFTHHTGTSFRRYRLWSRMTRVAAALSEGKNLTEAATAAGFASANHFSVSFHDMFGMTPRTLLSSGTRIVISEQDTCTA
ncbi:helix-turn-helix transcriptional regulator [Kibdelosporangium phytohabitans]|uniref:HTH araC/xylS-type domain-containing protein n=1 Tax=Kibdelosporangium phytohabitans TaxID=860235 RepID=A0A0N7F5P9_9PSEU|nr:helix-turn-helix domain-containing protein [Kibdelosporangium phytohabitans]ALG14839.1 hypothetical protein AOZ06_16645 [Kibdelosporangium phytohabitans]MBE1470648.1 AraC-like DNA-binding protein [Kibdelosporangium phytohabitans]